MGFLYLLEDIRTPILDKLMLLITELGSMAVFLVVTIVFFWCIDKKQGYFFAILGLAGTVLNQFMKLLFRVPRPWVLDSSFTIVEAAREGAGGYSFPSGHSQIAISTYVGIAQISKRRWLKILAVIVAVAVPFTRMYLGVHTPLDVLVAGAMALALAILLKSLVLVNDGIYLPYIFLVTVILSAGHLLFTILYPFPKDTDISLLASGKENALSLLGAMLGFLAAYFVDKRWINFSTAAVWWVQILKVVLGLLLMLAVKELFKIPMIFLLGENVGRIARYFFVTLTAGALWPATFRFLTKLGT